MINSSDFTDRLQKVMTYYSLSASAFADKIGVQRSSISHILSGRNKPSLEFVMKVLSSFDDVDLYWLLNGKGHFPSESTKTIKSNSEASNLSQPTVSSPTDDDIERIVIFYTDGRFKEYKSR